MKHPFLRRLLAVSGVLFLAVFSVSAQEPVSSPTPPPKAEKAHQKEIAANLNRIALDNQSITEIAKAGQSTGRIAITAPFAMAVMIVWIVAFVRNRRSQALHQTLRLMVEKGVPIPPELLVPPKQAPNDFRRGVLLIGFGMGLVITLAALSHKGVWSIGLVPLLLGVGYLVVARLGTKPPAGPGSSLQA